MAKKVFYQDSRGNRINALLNDNNQCFIQAGEIDKSYDNYICLNKEDLKSFIKDLQSILKEME